MITKNLRTDILRWVFINENLIYLFNYLYFRSLQRFITDLNVTTSSVIFVSFNGPHARYIRSFPMIFLPDLHGQFNSLVVESPDKSTPEVRVIYQIHLQFVKLSSDLVTHLGSLSFLSGIFSLRFQVLPYDLEDVVVFVEIVCSSTH